MECQLMPTKGLFSATQTRQVAELVRAGLRNPMSISVKVESKHSSVQQAVPTTLEIEYTVSQ